MGSLQLHSWMLEYGNCHYLCIKLSEPSLDVGKCTIRVYGSGDVTSALNFEQHEKGLMLLVIVT
jgi:hypothetical protein